MEKKFIFDYYLDNGILSHILIRYKYKKIIKIPFIYFLKSNNGICKIDDSNKIFLSLLNYTCVLEDGFDSIFKWGFGDSKIEDYKSHSGLRFDIVV